MPYMVVKQEVEGKEKHCVYKRGADDQPEGDTFGCHDTPEEASAQIAAIGVNTHSLWLDREQMKALCPTCAAEMEKKNLSKIDVLAFLAEWQKSEEAKAVGVGGDFPGNMPEQMAEGLCKKFGRDPGFYTRCEGSDLNLPAGWDRKAFCAELHKYCVGKWPAERSMAANYRKAITDAPGLRGVSKRSCWGCTAFTSLPSSVPGMPMNDSALRGICATHQFETSEAWVCDDWKDRFAEMQAEMASGKSLGDDALVTFGGEIKALDNGKIGGYLILFGSPEQPDLVGDYFTKETDFGPHKTSLVFYEHGMDGTLKRRVLDDSASLKVDDVGVWIEAQLKMRDEYEQTLYERLVKPKKAGWSSGTASHLVEREQKGNAWHITRWPLGLDASITVCPAEARLASAVVPLKSLSAYPLPAPEAQAQVIGTGDGDPVAPVAPDAGMAGAQPTPNGPQQAAIESVTDMEVIEMDEKKFDELMDKVSLVVTAAENATKAAAESTKSVTELIEKLKNEPATPEGGFNTVNVRVVRDESEYPFKSLGQQLQAVRVAALDPANTPKQLLALNDKYIKALKATGLNENIPSEGGFLVQSDFATELLKKVYEFGAITTRCRKIPISSGANSTTFNGIDETSRARGSRWGGVQIYWAAEAATVTSKKPKFRQIVLKLNKLMGLCYATDENMQDAAQLESIISQAFTEEFNYEVEDAIVNGTGAGQPLGLMNSAALVSVAKESGQLADTVVYENICKMWAQMWARSRQTAAWFISQDVEPQLFTMTIPVGTGGVPVYLPPGGASASPYGSLFGRPVIPVEYCATLGDKGDIVLADFSQYMLADKTGLQAASSIHVNFVYDESVFRFIYRVDGQPIWNSTLTPANSGSALSPFVTLAVRE